MPKIFPNFCKYKFIDSYQAKNNHGGWLYTREQIADYFGFKSVATVDKRRKEFSLTRNKRRNNND